MVANHKKMALLCRGVIFLCILLGIVFLPAVSAVAQTESKDEAKGPEMMPAKDPASAQAELAVVQYQIKAAKLESQMLNLRDKYLGEIEQRDLLVLQKRYLEAREFFYKANDYEGAAEILYGIVRDPASRNMPEYFEAIFFLAESLYHMGNYAESRPYYQMLYDIGPALEFFPMSLTRLVELAIIEEKYELAQQYYLDLLDRYPEGQDDSLATYLIGKSFYLRGKREKARAILQTISEKKAYYGVAQYFLAVMQVEDSNPEDAIETFYNLNEVLTKDVAHKQRLYELTHLSLARLQYDLDDFPRAMKEYYSIPPESPDYAEALYETLWVFITRNDRILQELLREQSRYSSLKYDYNEFMDGLRKPRFVGFAEEHTADLEETSEALDEIGAIFEEIESSMHLLMEEAVASFDKLKNAAPKSIVLPEAEILMGNVYNQAEEFEKAEEWYRYLKNKYADFKTRVESTRPQIQSQEDHMDLIESVISEADGAEDQSRFQLPSEIKGWLAEQEGVRESLDIIRRLERQEKIIGEMRTLMGEVEGALSKLQMDSAFPILNNAKVKARQLEEDAEKLLQGAGDVRQSILLVTDEDARFDYLTLLDKEVDRLYDLKASLSGVDTEVELKKSEYIERFNVRYQEIGRPVESYRYQTANLSRDTKYTAANFVRGKLERITKMIDTVVLKASLGEIDVAWRRTQQHNKDINEILNQQEEEIRRFTNTLEEYQE